jgi:antitoxin component YwqK of YwqJK toxin-antitoxin module
MQLIKQLLLLSCLIGLTLTSGCGQRKAGDGADTVDAFELRDIENRDGRVYLKGTELLFTGLLRELYPDGGIKAEAEFIDGRLHGKTRGFHPNAVLQVEENFLEGVSHGQRRRFDMEGRLVSLETIVNGEMHGLSEKYHPDGSLFEQGEYVKGVPHGLARMWNSSGVIQAEITFDHGKVTHQSFAADLGVVQSPKPRRSQP